MLVVRRFAVACAAAAALSCAAAPPAPADTRIVLEPYFRDLKVVHAKANNQPVTLLVDTGGGTTAISPSVAASLGRRPHGADVGHRMTGEAVTFQRCEGVTVTVGGWSRVFAPIGVFDVAALLPKELPPLDGVIALDAFAGRVLTIDWPSNGSSWSRPVPRPRRSGRMACRFARL